MQNSNIEEFNFENNENVRTVEKNGEVWFVLKDVSEVLGIQNHKDIAAKLDEDEVEKLYLTDSLGRQQNTFIVNESGLYKTLFRSSKPKAKAFTKWITSEVLPSIRKSGFYSLHSQITELQTRVNELASFKSQNLSKILFADAVSASDSSISVGDMAKILCSCGINTGQRRFFTQLRNDGFLVRTASGFNMPTQHAMKLKLFQVRETAISHSDGKISISITPRITGHGQAFFVEYYTKKFGTNNLLC